MCARGRGWGQALHKRPWYIGREDDYVIPWLCIKRIGDDLILVDGPLSEWRTPRKKRSLF